MKKAVLATVFAFYVLVAASQQQVMFTQYMFNGLIINPAYAGSDDAISFTGLSRIQWVGIEGAPNTQTFAVHSPIPGKQAGFGATFVRDNIGVTTSTNLYLAYSYRITAPFGRISFGLQGGFSSTMISFADLGLDDSNLQGGASGFKPNVGFGIYFQRDSFFAGISSPFLIKNRTQVGAGGLESEIPTDQIQHYYFSGGAIFGIAPLIKVKPGMLVKLVQGAPIEIDLNVNFLFDDILWLGASYRSLDAVSLLLEFLATNQLRFGYAYDITTSALRQVNAGSHEVMVNYRLVFNKNKIVTPRYF